MTRPDHIKCIVHTHADLRLGNPWKPDGTRDRGEGYLAWCGRDVRHEFHFVNVDHALYNTGTGGYLTACPECINAINKAAQEAAEGAYDTDLYKLLKREAKVAEVTARCSHPKGGCPLCPITPEDPEWPSIMAMLGLGAVRSAATVLTDYPSHTRPVGWYEGLKYIENQIWPHLPHNPNTYLAFNWRRADNRQALTGEEPEGTPIVGELRLDMGRHIGILTFYGQDAIAARLDMAEFLNIEVKIPWIRCECGEVFLGIRQQCLQCGGEVTTT